LLPGNRIVQDKVLIMNRKIRVVAIEEPKYVSHGESAKKIPKRIRTSVETAKIILILLILFDDDIILG
jgi:hypothetical protein